MYKHNVGFALNYGNGNILSIMLNDSISWMLRFPWLVNINTDDMLASDEYV